MMKKIIVNGANGFVGSNFIAELLNRNYHVIALVRGNDQFHAEERMRNALRELTTSAYINTSKLEVYSYTLLQNNFSLSESLLKKWFHDQVDYFHFAASLKFSKKTKDEILETNLDGLENSIRIFKKYSLSGSRFFFISTAYSCGNLHEPFMEDFYGNQDVSHFRNYYELSKRFAENIVRKYIHEHQVNAYVIRPSQVAGDSRTGITKTDFGIFDFAKRIYNIAHRYPGNRVRINASDNATQNLIPVDILVSYLLQVIEADQLPVIMNFVARNPVKNQVIIKYLSDNLPIDIIPISNLDKSTLTPLEKLIDLGMSFTGGYCNINPEFSTKNLERVVRPVNIEITTRILHKMLQYFIDNTLKIKSMQKTTTLNQ